MVDGYAAIARIDVGKAWAWARVNELAKQAPEMWGELPAMLTQRMQAL